MKILFLFLFLFLFSCAYPDIDTVPNFENLNISTNEAIDLCTYSKKNINLNYVECLASYINSNPTFEDLKLTEVQSIKLCKLINADSKDFINCLVKYYEN